MPWVINARIAKCCILEKSMNFIAIFHTCTADARDLVVFCDQLCDFSNDTKSLTNLFNFISTHKTTFYSHFDRVERFFPPSFFLDDNWELINVDNFLIN